MKKQFAIITYILLLFIGANSDLFIKQSEAVSNDQLTIPDEAIRLRILANSDSDQDQALKRMIRDEVNKEITLWVQQLTSIEAARDVIKSRLAEIETIVEDVLERENAMQAYSVDFDDNVDFPTKLYGKFLYPAGEYEAILITLGEGNGANWWCVLFPPLCFLDFSNGEAVEAAEVDTDDTEPKTETSTEEDLEEDEKEKEELEEVVQEDEEEKPEAKFFIVEFFSSLFS